ncbi:hypothetical protein CJ030_MR4G013738 [Morella rubra]|uniref:Uncharacterized protein n=1 Tax=Morella rubra TaxID=262757 RepID=A0A6A1WTR0_9ROSI|nr:hypothetical protein CJ030_MR4G013738 [Morella rubra]
MKAATKKKKLGLPYGMLFIHIFHILEVDMTGEVREKSKDSKKYNKKTLRLMGFVQNDDGEWIGSSSIFPADSSHEPHLSQHEDSIAEIKKEPRKLGKNIEDMTTNMKTKFQDIKKLLVVHTKRFGALDKEMRGLKHQVNNSLHVASNVIQEIVDEFASTSAELQASVKSSAQDVVQATMDILVLYDLDGLAERV